MAGAEISANATAAPRSLYIAIGFLPVKVPEETTPPVYGSFRDAPVTQA